MQNDDIADIVWDFDRQLAQGTAPEITALVQKFPDARRQLELLVELIRCELAHAGWERKAVQDRLRLYARYNSSRSAAVNLVGCIYTDRLDAGEYPVASDFDDLDYTLEELKLRRQEEPVFLGETLGGCYRIEQQLGVGSYGIVYRAKDAADRAVAIKTVRRAGANKEELAISLLTQEAEALGKLPCPGIPRLLAVGKDSNDLPYIVKEFVDGCTLRQRVQKGRLAPQKAAETAAALADTLAFIHRHGYIHRDLSPANVLIDASDQPFLTDFGIAVSQAQQFEREGEVAGTRGYMAVESLLGMGRQLDGRADIWSLGAILYELLTGSPLDTSDCREGSLVWAIVLGKQTLEYPDDVPDELRNVCSKCLVRDADRRFDTAGMVATALRKFLGEIPASQDDSGESTGQLRLMAWRIGMKLGCAIDRQRRTRWHLQQMHDGSPQAKPMLDRNCAMALGEGFGMVEDFDACVEASKQLGADLARIENSDKYGRLVYRGMKISSDDIERFREFILASGQPLEAAFAQLRSLLKSHGPEVAELFNFIVRASICMTSEITSGELEELATAAGISSDLSDRFIALISAKVDLGELRKELDRLYKLVESKLSIELSQPGLPVGI